MIIAICDDEKKWRTDEKSMIEKYAEISDLEVSVVTFESGEALFTYKGSPIDVLFMDIDLREDNGIRLAKEVNEKWPSCQIVYATNYLYYATEIFHTKHEFFVLKEQFEKKLPEVLQKVIHNWKCKGKKLAYKAIGAKRIVLYPEEIYCFERDKRVTRIKTARETYEIWEKMGEIEEELAGLDFVRCHNSYIINLSMVTEMEMNSFYLSNGDKIPISRAHSKAAKQAFGKWAFSQMS